MTTQTTTIRTSSSGMRALIGAAASLAVLGGALLWQVRPTSETTAPTMTTSISTTGEGVAPLGGLAEQYRDEQRAAAAAGTARVTTLGGMAEHYAEQLPVATTAPATTLGGLAERYAEEQAAARADVSRLERMGGLAELYREQTTAASAR